MSGMTHYFNRIVSRVNDLPEVDVVYVTPVGFEKIAESEAVHQTKDGANFPWFELPIKQGNKFNLKALRKFIIKEKVNVIVFSSEYKRALFSDPRFLFLIAKNHIGTVMKSIPFRVKEYDLTKRELSKDTSYIRGFIRTCGLKFDRFTYRLSDAHICYIPEARQIYSSYGVDPNRIVISFNSPDTDELLKIREKIEKSSSKPERKITRIIHIGRLVEWKRVDLLIGAVARLKESIPDIELIVIGYGPMEPSLHNLAIERGVSERVQFTGGIYDPDELGRMLLSAGLYVLAGMGGISINDAMCFGLPVICSICDGTEKILVKDGLNGLYFKPEDEIDLSDKIRSIICNPEKWNAMSEASTSIIHNEININTLLSGYQNVFDIVKRHTAQNIFKRWVPFSCKRFIIKYFMPLVVTKRKKLDRNIKVKRTARIKCNSGGEIQIGSNTEILDYALLLTYGGSIKIGERCSINPFCVIYGHGGVVIGNDVLIAAHTVIIPSNHNFDDTSRTIMSQGNTSKGIIIEDDVWIGSGCKILDGVTIGKGSVIGAGSVVTRSIEPFSIAVGVPARIVRKRIPIPTTVK